MSYFKAVFDFNRPVEDKVSEERDIYAKMLAVSLFANPPIAYPICLAAIDAQQLAIDNAKNGGRIQIALMRTKERIVDDIFRKYRDYVTELADGDTDIILSSGFRHTKGRASAGDMDKVAGVKRLPTSISGALKLRWKPVKNVGFYEVEVREVVSENPVPPTPPVPPSPPLPPESGNSSSQETVVIERPWKIYSSKPSRVQITGLKPLKYYEVRVRAKGTKGFGGYSDIVVMVVT